MTGGGEALRQRRQLGEHRGEAFRDHRGRHSARGYANGGPDWAPTPGSRSGRPVRANRAGRRRPDRASGGDGGWRRWLLVRTSILLRGAADTSQWRSRRTSNRRRHSRQFTRPRPTNVPSRRLRRVCTEQRATPAATQAGRPEVDTGDRQIVGGEQLCRARRARRPGRPAGSSPYRARRIAPSHVDPGTPAHRVGGEDDHRRDVVAEPSVEDDGLAITDVLRLTASTGRSPPRSNSSTASHPSRSLRPLSSAASLVAAVARPIGRGCSGWPGQSASDHTASARNPPGVAGDVVGGDEAVTAESCAFTQRTEARWPGAGGGRRQNRDRAACSRPAAAVALGRVSRRADRQVAQLGMVENRGHADDARRTR